MHLHPSSEKEVRKLDLAVGCWHYKEALTQFMLVGASSPEKAHFAECTECNRNQCCLPCNHGKAWVKTMLILICYDLSQKFLSEMQVLCFRSSCERTSFIPFKMTCGCGIEDVGSLPDKIEQNYSEQ